MKDSTLYLGLDVHAEQIWAVAVDGAGAERNIGIFANRPESIRKLIKKAGKKEDLRAVYEAGPTGYQLYWELEAMGVSCEVAAPSLIPTKAGDRVKTDRRDARKLARYHRSGDLSYVRVPDRAQEGLRDVVRARAAAKEDERRARQRVRSFLLRHGLRPSPGVRAWTQKYRSWLRGLEFEDASLEATLRDFIHEVDHQELRVKRFECVIDEAIERAPEEIREVIQALQCLRGVRRLTAAGVVAEVGLFSRFSHPSQLMGYTGVVPSEYTSGGADKHRRGAITKSGNSHLRKLVIESAWSYRYQPGLSYVLKKRQEGQLTEVVAIAWKAQVRLCGRYRRLSVRKPSQKVVTAIGRELLGFMWAIGCEVERQLRERQAA